MKRKSLAGVAWARLTPTQKERRVRALGTLKEMRRGDSLRTAAKEHNISERAVKRYLGRFIHKRGNRWVASKTDRIQRGMSIQSDGKLQTIIVTNSKDASLLGQHNWAVRIYIEDGNKKFLAQFKNVVIIDADGKSHTLETRPEKLKDIDDEQEDAEEFQIYDMED